MAIAARHELEERARDKPLTAWVLPRSIPAAPTKRRHASSATEDFYSTSVPWVLLAITLLPFVVLGLWLVVAYLGIEYGTPPWNTHSVPPPQLY